MTMTTKNTKPKDGDAVSSLPSSDMLGCVKLKNQGSILSLDGVLRISPTDSNGSNWNKARLLKIWYKDGNHVELSYGYDDHGKTLNAAKCDEDFDQLADALILPNVERRHRAND